MGGSLHRKMVDRADEHGGRHAGSANLRHASRRRGQPRAGQSVPALCVRSVDGTDTPRASVVSVCRRRAGALSERAGSAGYHGRASATSGRVPSGDASDKDQGRLLQGWQSQREPCQPGIRLPGLLLPAEAGEELQAGQPVLELLPRGQPGGAHRHAEAIRESNFRNRTQGTLEDVARELNPVLRGWMEYYGRYSPSALYPVFRHVNRSLVAWAMRKYKRLAGHRTRASVFLEAISKKSPHLFAHWQRGTVGGFA